MTKFSALNISKPLLRALTDLSFEQATPIQAKAFPVIMSGADVIGIAQTGTGKTLAYLLPLLRQLTYSEQRQPRILIVVPTRELVTQVTAELGKIGKYTSFRFGGVYGGGNINTQKQMVYNGLDILVATPGRLMDLYLTRVLQFSSIQKLVVDEVDEMLNLGFRKQLTDLLDALPKKRQNLLFSATLSVEAEQMIKENFSHPVYLESVSRGTPLDQINQCAYRVPNFYTKVKLLHHLLLQHQHMKRVLVFTKNKKYADTLYESLQEEAVEQVGLIHSNKSQAQRFNSVKQFQEGGLRVLIASDVIARGLDIKDISHVINFDMPEEPEVYIHRIGRTGRAQKAGEAISFINKPELLEKAEKLMGMRVQLMELPEEIEISQQFLEDERPFVKDKNVHKVKAISPSGPAFHEKKEKNKKVNKGGKRRQESKRRERIKMISKRKK